MTKKQETRKTLTVRMPDNVHKKLRMLAAMREQNLTEVIVDLIKQAKLQDPQEVTAVKDLLYGMAEEHALIDPIDEILAQ